VGERRDQRVLWADAGQGERPGVGEYDERGARLSPKRLGARRAKRRSRAQRSRQPRGVRRARGRRWFCARSHAGSRAAAGDPLSEQFVYLHAIWFAAWIIFKVERYPYGLLTMIVSL
jgi:hypothetical protein